VDLGLELWTFRQDVVEASQQVGLTVADELRQQTRELSNAHEAMWGGVFALAEALPNLSAPIIEQLCALGIQIEKLTDLIANPEATRADELYRRSVMAFTNQWLDEAGRDALLAIEADPYHYGAYYLLGRIAVLQNRPIDAGQFFATSARYAAPVDPKVAVTAALAAIHSYRGQGGDPEAGAQTGRSIVKALKIAAPQLLLATARLTGETSYAAAALLADPGILPAAKVTRLPGLEEACSQIVEPLTQRVQTLASMLKAMDEDYVRPMESWYRENSSTALPCPVCSRFDKTFPLFPLPLRQTWTQCPYPKTFVPNPNYTPYPAMIERFSHARSMVPTAPSTSPMQAVGALAAAELELYSAWRLGMGMVWFLLQRDGPLYKIQAPDRASALDNSFRRHGATAKTEARELYALLPEIVRAGE
jgi:hypothetical protein